jgi:hypothetical protein
MDMNVNRQEMNAQANTLIKMGALKKIIARVIGGCILSVFFFSCKSPESKERDAAVQTGKDLKMAQKDNNAWYFKKIQQFKKSEKFLLTERERKLKNRPSSPFYKTTSEKQDSKAAVIAVQDKITTLLKRLDEYNEEGETNAENFLKNFQIDLSDLDKSINALGCNNN